MNSFLPTGIGKYFDTILIDVYKNQGFDEFIKKINEYTEYLKQKLSMVEYQNDSIFEK